MTPVTRHIPAGTEFVQYHDTRSKRVEGCKISGRLHIVENDTVWIITRDLGGLTYIGVPLSGTSAIPVLPDPPEDAMKTTRQLRRDEKKRKREEDKAKREKKVVKSGRTPKISGTSDVAPKNGYISFRGSTAVEAGEYFVLSGPHDNRRQGKAAITDADTQICVKHQGVYYVIAAA